MPKYKPQTKTQYYRSDISFDTAERGNKKIRKSRGQEQKNQTSRLQLPKNLQKKRDAGPEPQHRNCDPPIQYHRQKKSRHKNTLFKTEYAGQEKTVQQKQSR